MGSFFALSGFHKLTNKERHKTFQETLRVLGIPHVGVLQWFVPNSPTVVESYKPIDSADRVDDWLYQPK